MANQTPTYSICGFDVGSENCYIAVARGGGIEILLNDYSQRSTPSYVALGDKQRELGVSAKQKQLMNMQSTFYAMKRLVGRQYNEVVNHEQLPFPIEQGEHGDVVVRITHNDEETVFCATQILAMLFTKLRQISNNAVDCVINYPNYFTDAQKRSLFDAALMAGLNPLRLLSDAAAIGVYYGFYRTSSGEDSTVVFVDLGQTTTQCAVIQFRNKQAQSTMQILGVESDGNLGGRNFDEVLAEHFIKKHNLSLNKRGKHRLLTECEKVKKQMSANSNKMPVNVECLYEDRDFSSSITRDEFEELAKDYFERIESMLKKVLEKGHEKYLLLQKGDEKPVDFKVDAVEIVGGGSRIPAVKRMIKDIFNLEPTTTLNADEAVARGCALQCAMLSPTFKVARELFVNDYNVYPINCKYWFESEVEKITELKDVFSRGSVTPFTRRITLNCSSLPLYFELEYGLDNGGTASIGQFKVSSIQSLVLQKNKLSLFVKIDANGLVSLSSANVVIEDKQNFNGQAENEAEQPMETEPKETTDNSDTKTEDSKDKKNLPKSISVQLLVEPQWIRGKLSDAELIQCKEIESNLILADKNWKERIDARNELEEYVYEWRGKMEDGRYDPFILKSEKETFLKELNSMEQWLYADEESGEPQSKAVYSEKLLNMKVNYSNHIIFRENEFSSRDQFLERLGKTLQLAQKLLETEEVVDEKKIQKLKTEVEAKQRWFEESHSTISNTPLTANPVITTKNIQENIDQLESATKPIMDELHRKKQEKQRAEEEKRKKEEDEKKKADEVNTATDQTSTQPMDVDGQAVP